MIKCEKCGKELDSVLINQFCCDGSDAWVKEPIIDNREGVIYFETSQNWTGYGLSDEERLETICCPYCKEYPFKLEEIEAHEVVQVFCFTQEEKEEKKCVD